MNRLYSELCYVIEAQNSIKRSIFRLLDIRESDGEDDDDDDKIPFLIKQNVTDIEINGIPEEQAESLQYILSRLSRHMFSEVFPAQVEIIYRLRTSKKPRPIIVNLKSPVTARELLTAYTEYNERNRHCNLNSRDLGFTGMKLPVLLSEHPSKLNKAHRRAVRQKIKKYKQKKRAKRTAAKASGKQTATKATAKKHGDNHSTKTFTENNSVDNVAGHSSASHAVDNRPTGSNTNNNTTNNGGSYLNAKAYNANIYEDSSDDDTNYSKSRIFHNSNICYKSDDEANDIAIQNEKNTKKLRESTINKKGPKSLHKKSKPGKQVTSLRDFALSEVNKQLFG